MICISQPADKPVPRRQSPGAAELKRQHAAGGVNPDQQQHALDLAARLGADPREIVDAIRLMRTGRADLLIQVTAQKLTIKAALVKAAAKREGGA